MRNPTTNLEGVSCEVCCEGSRRKPMAQSCKSSLGAEKGPRLTAGKEMETPGLEQQQGGFCQQPE